MRRYRRWAFAAIVLYGFISAAFLALGYVSLHQGQKNLGAARDELKFKDVNNLTTGHVKNVADSLKSAHAALGSPVVAPLKLVPVFGRQLKAIDSLAKTGNKVLRVGIEALDRGRVVANNPPKNGAERVKAARDISNIAHASRAKLTGLDLGPAQHLFSPIAKARQDFLVEINRVGDLLAKADVGGGALAKFLTGPSHYALFAANNDAMRAGSGEYLAGGTLDVTNGEITLGKIQSVYKLPPAPTDVPLERDYLALWGLEAPGSSYLFANTTPRFPTTGALIQRMWAASGQAPVDGVIVVDPQLTTNLLRVIGPQTVGNVTVSATNALQLLLHDQYIDFVADDEAGNANRREFNSEVTAALFEKINTGSFKPTTLGQAFGTAASGRHLLAWTNNESVEQGWISLGMDGQVPDQSVMFALINRNPNKLDYFMRTAAQAAVKVSRAGTDVTMDFTLVNTTPPGQPRYIVGNAVGIPGQYLGLVSVNLPANATDVKLAGGTADRVKGPDGNTQNISQYVLIEPGATQKLQLTFRLPPGYNALKILPSARIPGVFWNIGSTKWVDTEAKVIYW